MDDLKGKVALVTGSSRGIGRAIALAMAEAGADIVVNYRDRLEDANQTESGVRQAGRRCVNIQADVSLPADVERLIQTSESAFGAVDILVNNAGIARPQALDEIQEADWDDLLASNLKSCFLMSQRVLPGMRAKTWGRIVNISSVAASVGGIVGPHYAASKAGMLGLTRYYASHLAREGITVNAIAPALIETEMVTANLNAQPGKIPVGRFGDVDEVASVAVLLASNGYITGQTIHVNGGWYLT
jgi:3-oxoacyl-[acyl-carrier protein] reductase